MPLIDSHCHLTYEPMYSNLDKLVHDCQKNNISHMLSISTNLETATRSISIADKYRNIYTSIGLHPCEVKNNFKDIDDILKLYKNSKKIIGIGEIGLDYYRDQDNKNYQIEAFEKQINFAIKKKLPVIVHTRSANEDTISIIKKNAVQNKIKFLIHCFSESSDFCKKLIDLDCYISFSGIVTFKNAKEVQKSATLVPIDRILIETDSPYLSPEPHRGKINSPLNINFIANYLSKLKKINFKSFEEQTSKNFNTFFGL